MVLKEYCMCVKLAGTVYVKAASEDEARAKVLEAAGIGCCLQLRDGDQVLDDDGSFLSAALTSYGPFDGDEEPIDRVD